MYSRIVRDAPGVQAGRNPDWTRDEIILACDLVRQVDWRPLRRTDLRAIELSELLRRLPIHRGVPRAETFRNPSSVARKTADIATSRDGYSGKQTRGNRMDKVVLDEFLREPDRMAATAQAIRAAATQAWSPTPPDIDLESAPEGGLLERRHFVRERDPKLRAAKISAVERDGGAIACEACGFNFATTYGDHGAGFIESHHRVPLHESGPTKTKLSDLALLCSNCHRMIHRHRPWLTVDQLKGLLTSDPVPHG